MWLPWQAASSKCVTMDTVQTRDLSHIITLYWDFLCTCYMLHAQSSSLYTKVIGSHDQDIQVTWLGSKVTLSLLLGDMENEARELCRWSQHVYLYRCQTKQHPWCHSNPSQPQIYNNSIKICIPGMNTSQQSVPSSYVMFNFIAVISQCCVFIL